MLLWICPSLVVIRPSEAEPFATAVIAYEPAPGQFVNVAEFNDPVRALGPPRGGGTSAADNTSVVTLGGFGGSITLSFDHTVMDDPLNPFGMDAIVFGNAFWSGGNPSDHWAECATIEISLDANENDRSDDPWFLIPGSHIPNPGDQWLTVAWDADVSDDTFPPALGSWIPPGSTGAWTTGAHALPADLFGTPIVRNPSLKISAEGIYGYADYSPTLLTGDLDADNTIDDLTITPETFHTVPDDPFTVGITPGSGGGDAFDIAWAIDPDTGLRPMLPGFDFIRITTAVYASSNIILGEKSAEIDAVADAAPDPFGDFDQDGDIDLLDLAGLYRCYMSIGMLPEQCDRVDREQDGVVDLADARAMTARLTGPKGE